MFITIGYGCDQCGNTWRLLDVLCDQHMATHGGSGMCNVIKVATHGGSGMCNVIKVATHGGSGMCNVIKTWQHMEAPGCVM